ncbi:hypothetical protein V6N13_070308 [Hibiscus sabdariffa]
MHWKGLWYSFARHGEVESVYIAWKRSRGGKRFGFVRMKDKKDADRIIERLHGFKLYGSTLTVKYARNSLVQSGRSTERKREFGIELGRFAGRNKEISVEAARETGDTNIPARPRQKSITAHVVDEELWKLRKCLVGEMSTVCSVSSISNRLLKWGMGEIKVQRMGARSFLLTIEDEELFLMLEDLEWSYLKEIFSDIKLWSESVSYSERATWLEVTGLPLYCWNAITLKKIAGLWGNFEALGVNANHSRDCEKARVRISTSQLSKIEEVIKLDVGDKIFNVGVVEIGFSDQSDSLLDKKWMDANDKGVDIYESESVSDSKSEQGDKVAVEEDRSRSWTEVEAFNVMCAEKDHNNCLNREKENFRGQINDEELMGGFSNKESLMVKCGSGEEEINQLFSKEGHVEKELNFIIEEPLKVVSEELADKKDTGADEIELGPISEHAVTVGKLLAKEKTKDIFMRSWNQGRWPRYGTYGLLETTRFSSLDFHCNDLSIGVKSWLRLISQCINKEGPYSAMAVWLARDGSRRNEVLKALW